MERAFSDTPLATRWLGAMRRSLPLGGNSLGLSFADEPARCCGSLQPRKQTTPSQPSSLPVFPVYLSPSSPLPSLPIRPRRPFVEFQWGFRIRMGRYPAEIAEGAEVYWEGEKRPTSEPFSTTALVN